MIKPRCPECQMPLTHRALVDSDDRVFCSWYVCDGCRSNISPKVAARYREEVARINRATDREIDAAVTTSQRAEK